MDHDEFVRLARREIQRRICILPARLYRWGTAHLPDDGEEAAILIIRGKKEGSGFDVLVGISRHGIEIACSGWHSHAWERANWERAEDLCADFGEFLQALLSPATRLVVESRRGRPCRWRLEREGGEGWEGLEEVVRIHLPWGEKGREVRQNTLLPVPTGGAAIGPRAGCGLPPAPSSWR